ncbi:MAG: helix-turn-helix domain-containing protein [Rhodocyclales bacterium]|nr:helix-turn-helix domain-containing protein [Rhodocyclales bacterium]
MSELEVPAIEAQAVPGPGAMLRMAREARGTTIAEVAAALKMSPRQIEAIEGEDFSRLSGATFIRGFIRNYARLLKIDAAPVLDALAEQTTLPQAELNAPADAGVKMPTSNSRQGKGLLGATVLALAVLGVALALYFDAIDIGVVLKLKRQGGPPASRQEDLPQLVRPLPQPVAAVQSSAPEERSAVEAKPADSPEKPVPKPGTYQLIFIFDGSSWVEVKDATGRTVLSQMNAKGTTQVVEGRPPFQLVVGNASHVRLQYNDQPVDLRPHTRVEVARLTLE